MSKEITAGQGFGLIAIGIMLSIFFVSMYINVYEIQDVSKETLDEVCTQLSGQPSELNYPESTSEQIICNPMEKKDEKVLDDGKIVLKGYKEEVKIARTEVAEPIKSTQVKCNLNSISEIYDYMNKYCEDNLQECLKFTLEKKESN